MHRAACFSCASNLCSGQFPLFPLDIWFRKCCSSGVTNIHTDRQKDKRLHRPSKLCLKVVSHLWRWSLRHVKFDAWVQRNPITLTASSWRSNLTPPPWAWASSWRKRQISWTYPTCKTSVKLNAQAPKADASQSWNNWTSASRQIGNLMLCSLLYSAFKLAFLSSLALSWQIYLQIT
jgi:hypothetical protein